MGPAWTPTAGSWAAEHLQWMAQKDALGQDMFLLGEHGPLRRWVAMAFCEVQGREIEYIALTQVQRDARTARPRARARPPVPQGVLQPKRLSMRRACRTPRSQT